jgi:hypothetical protein
MWQQQPHSQQQQPAALQAAAIFCNSRAQHCSCCWQGQHQGQLLLLPLVVGVRLQRRGQLLTAVAVVVVAAVLVVEVVRAVMLSMMSTF